MTNPQEEKIKLLEVIPSDKIYAIHNELRKYHNKWDSEQVIELADTSGIENFYNAIQYGNRTVPIAGAALVAKGYTEAGAVTAGISLYVDYLITTGKEKLFKSELKKKKITELKKDIEDLYDRQQELSLILKPLRTNEPLPNLSELINTLKTELEKVAQKGEISENNNHWKKYLSYLFWSLRKDESSKLKELILLNNGVKVLDSWTKLPWSAKTWTELSRLFLSLRKGDSLWTEWENKWEARRTEHKKIQDLLFILQTVISEYQQDIPIHEIEAEIAKKLALITHQLIEETLEFSENSLVNEETSEIKRRKSHHTVDIEPKQIPQSHIEIPAK